MLEDFISRVIEKLATNLEYKRKKKIREATYILPQRTIISLPEIEKYRKHERKYVEKRKKLRKTIKIPRFEIKKLTEQEKIKRFLHIEAESKENINIYYPTTKEKIGDKEYIFAYAWIRWDSSKKTLVYDVIEPKLGEKEREIINKTLKILESKIDVPLEELKDISKIKEYILEKVDEIWKLHKIKVEEKYEPYIKYYILRDTVGYGKIDPLMNDPQIEDISCNGVGIPIFIFHRNPYIGEIQTNIVFDSAEELDSFVMRLALRTGRVVSVSNPLLDAALPDGSRIQITYGKDISRKGSSFTIRKFTKDPFTPIDIINYETADLSLLAYLWTLIEEGKSILIAGGTATGKTSLLNAISLFIRPEKKVVSIEDTPELQLPHPNWLAEVARPGFGPQRYGEVNLVDLLKAALRQRPDYIVVGEVRGAEAYVLFQAMATGHAGLGTIHAETFEALVDRLISPPISLPPVLLEVLDAVIFLKRIYYKGKYVRKIDRIYEIIGWNRKKNEIEKIISYKWDPKTDVFISGSSIALREIMEMRGWDNKALEENLEFKIKILEYLWKNNIRNYKEFSKYIEMYYSNPSELAKIVSF